VTSWTQAGYVARARTLEYITTWIASKLFMRIVGGEGEQMLIVDLWPHGPAEGLRNGAYQGIASVCLFGHYTGASL
jgi:hypothetical protein